jgi:type II secretory pathway pseudopilin PulG
VRRRAQAGFTLLGLLFLVAGLGVAMAALGTVWNTAAQREKERDLLFVGDQYRRAVESFWQMPLPVGTPRRLPQDVGELLKDPRFPNTVRHLRRAWRDPMTGQAEWGLLEEPDGGISGVYSLSEAKPFKSGNFPPEYAQFKDAKSYRDWVFRFDVEKALREAGRGGEGTPPPAANAPPPNAAGGQ